MYLIIVGAGRTGRRTIELATRDHHEVVVIEDNEQAAREAANDYECRVINEKATKDGALEKAGVDEADVLITTSNDDEVNLFSILIGRQYGVPRMLSSVNNPAYIEIFHRLTVDIVVEPWRLLGEYLYRNAQKPEFQDFVKLYGGVELFEIKLDKHSNLLGKTILEAVEANIITRYDIIVSIFRKGEIIIPHGNTQFEIGDAVAILSKQGINKNLISSKQKFK